MDAPPFGAEVVDGRVYGRGAGDDKASVTAQVMGAIALARSGVPLRGRLAVTEVADEETTGNGAKHLVAAAGLRPDGFIVGEQTLNRVAIGEKGTAGVASSSAGARPTAPCPGKGPTRSRGSPASSSPSATSCCPACRSAPIRTSNPRRLRSISSRAASKANVVPDRCAIFIDRRLVPGEDPWETTAEIRAIVDRAVAGLPGIAVEVDPTSEMRAATMSDPAGSLAQAMLAANSFLGLSTDLTGFSMATDARHFAAAGYPTIIYGPGDPRLAHVPDEWVGIDEVLEATRAYALAALALLGSREVEESRRG